MKTLYVCEICGQTSEDKSVIEKCESRGVPTPLVNVGDIICFNDCPETPILYNHSLYYGDIDLSPSMVNILNTAKLFFNQTCKYTVKRIDIDGHNISYKLGGIKGESVCMDGWNSSVSIYYPCINGNEFMKKVLQEYNQSKN
jgi:hypothetical protein